MQKSGYKGQSRAPTEATEATEAWLEATDKCQEASEVWLGVPEVWLGIPKACFEEPGNWTRVFLALAGVLFEAWGLSGPESSFSGLMPLRLDMRPLSPGLRPL